VSTATEKTLSVGDQAPDFTLKTIGLKEVSLHDYRGKKNVVLLFYPLDWTPG
jgi:peroxiredoxin